MKLKRVKILMILLLLIFLNGLVQAQTISPISLRASNLKDTTNVNIPISILKQANERLIERKYLISIYYEQDSIIKLKDNYISYQQDVITDMQHKIIDNALINEDLQKSLDKQKKKTKFITYGAASAVVGLLIGLLSK